MEAIRENYERKKLYINFTVSECNEEKSKGLEILFLKCFPLIVIT